MIKYFQYYLFCTISILYRGNTFALLAEYGDKCDQITARCNNANNLGCANNVCTCFSTFYDNVAKKCVAAIGDPCKIPHFTYKGDIDKPCPSNATCAPPANTPGTSKVHGTPDLVKAYNSVHVCTCLHGFATDKLRQACHPVLGFGETCGPKLLDCDARVGLSCGKLNTCICDNTKVYDKKSRKCLSRVGTSCRSHDECEEGTICEIYQSYPEWAQRSPFGRCECPLGSVPSSEGKCVGTFGTTCSKDEPCNKEGFLACVDGICQCERGSSEIVDLNNYASCRLPVGSPCSKAPKYSKVLSNGSRCVGNATCADGYCKMMCDKGLSSSNPLGKCLSTYGSSCDVTRGTFCNNFEGLACIDGECSCFDSLLKWDKKQNVCVAKKNGNCGKFKIWEGYMVTVIFDYSHLSFVEEHIGVVRYVVGCGKGYVCQQDKQNLSGDMKICIKN